MRLIVWNTVDFSGESGHLTSLVSLLQCNKKCYINMNHPVYIFMNYELTPVYNNIDLEFKMSVHFISFCRV